MLGRQIPPIQCAPMHSARDTQSYLMHLNHVCIQLLPDMGIRTLGIFKPPAKEDGKPNWTLLLLRGVPAGDAPLSTLRWLPASCTKISCNLFKPGRCLDLLLTCSMPWSPGLSILWWRAGHSVMCVVCVRESVCMCMCGWVCLLGCSSLTCWIRARSLLWTFECPCCYTASSGSISGPRFRAWARSPKAGELTSCGCGRWRKSCRVQGTLSEDKPTCLKILQILLLLFDSCRC